MRLVLDASVGLKTVLPESGSQQAVELRDAYLTGFHDLIAPDTYPIECAHALAKAERRGILSPGEGQPHLRRIVTDALRDL